MLERSLLGRLAGVAGHVLYAEFGRARPFGNNLVHALAIRPSTSPDRSHYERFTARHRRDGLRSLIRKYPVLGRVVTMIIDDWVEGTGEFIERLGRDRAGIHERFAQWLPGETSRPSTKDTSTLATSNDPLGLVIGIDGDLSDPHKGGRCVFLVRFESNLKLVYKPKSLALEVAFGAVCDWCNERSGLLPVRAARALDMGSHGWAEFIEHVPCGDAATIERFYRCAGMLLALLNAFRATDCHYENVVASGEHFVPVDLETLLHHEPARVQGDEAADLEDTAFEQLWTSVIRTGLLPTWRFSADHRIAFDDSALGSTETRQSPFSRKVWENVNTDAMAMQTEPIVIGPRENAATLDGVVASPADHVEHIVAGFVSMYRFIASNRAALTRPDGVLGALEGRQVRFIFRDTQVYRALLDHVMTPWFLKDGADYSIEIDHLARAFVASQEKPAAWPILRAELEAMERLDIPFFTAKTSEDSLELGDGSIVRYFDRPSYDDMLQHLGQLSEPDLKLQEALIRGAFHARIARSSGGLRQERPPAPAALLTRPQMVEHASRIGSDLESRMLVDARGVVNWIGLVAVPTAGCFQLQTLGDDLYDGRAGIALFLAALFHVTGEERMRRLALGAVQTLRRKATPDGKRAVGTSPSPHPAGLGGATGVGGQIYALAVMAGLLGEEDLLRDSERLVESISPRAIAEDRHFDVVAGGAGAILGLLAHYDVTRSDRALSTAAALGRNLVTTRTSYEGLPRAWHLPGERPLSGMSHGAAGIAYALLRLHAVTKDTSLREAALEGIDYERTLFSARAGNWPDLRRSWEAAEPSYPVRWCHGAPGIALARIGSSRYYSICGVQSEIDVALATTRAFGAAHVDHLCCGSMGLSESLAVGARHRGRGDHAEQALRLASSVIADAAETGTFRLFANLPRSVYSPGLFVGAAGIGYQLLRLATTDLPCVLLWETVEGQNGAAW